MAALRAQKRLERCDKGIYYGDNANDVYFDGIQLMRDDGESYVYDDDGNLISAKSAAEKAGTH